MSVEVIHGTTGKPAAADALAKAVRGRGDFTGRLVIGYPILPTPPFRSRYRVCSRHREDQDRLLSEWRVGGESGGGRQRNCQPFNQPIRQKSPSRSSRKRVHFVREVATLSQPLVRSNGSGFGRPAPQRRVSAPEHHASATRSAVLGGTGDENLAGDEASLGSLRPHRPFTIFGAIVHNRHSHRIPLPLSLFEFTLDSVFVAAVTTDRPRTLVRQPMTALPVRFGR